MKMIGGSDTSDIAKRGNTMTISEAVETKRSELMATIKEADQLAQQHLAQANVQTGRAMQAKNDLNWLEKVWPKTGDDNGTNRVTTTEQE